MHAAVMKDMVLRMIQIPFANQFATQRAKMLNASLQTRANVTMDIKWTNIQIADQFVRMVVILV